jgi:formylglycine-generating enzyme required for sulfatase activity
MLLIRNMPDASFSLVQSAFLWQAFRPVILGASLCLLPAVSVLRAEPPAKLVLDVPNSTASTEAEMKPYREVISGTEIEFDMLPIPGGKFLMGSPDGEKDRKGDEEPQHEVSIEPFWMAKFEMTWDAYETWSFGLDIQRRQLVGIQPTPLDPFADAVTRPTKPFTDMSFSMGKDDGYPAISMTQLAAKKFCEWLSAKTGRYYRLPTEAEWEYACRAGSKTAYHFGDDPAGLDDYAWYFDNSDGRYQKVGKKKPNAWGLHDMHGNVAEWVLDHYSPDSYRPFAGKVTANPYVPPKELYSRVVRGGSWDDDPELLRSAARRASHADWKQQDPQFPQSQWYLTDAQFLGFRVVRPLREPTVEEQARYGPDKIQHYKDDRR